MLRRFSYYYVCKKSRHIFPFYSQLQLMSSSVPNKKEATTVSGKCAYPISSSHCIVVICVALPFVLPDVHKVVAPIQSADPLFLMSARLAGAASSGIADGGSAGTNHEPRRDCKL